MTNILAGLCALLGAVLLAPRTSAQSESRAPGIEETIRSLENQERAAVLAGDTAKLEQLWATTMIPSVLIGDSAPTKVTSRKCAPLYQTAVW
jgi:hypothetical protein